MNLNGPQLQKITRRIAETPADFFDEPRIGKNGQLNVAALVNDCLRRFGYVATIDTLTRFTGKKAREDQHRLQLAALAVWVLDDDWFKDKNIHASTLLLLLDEGLTQLAQSTKLTKCVNDSERREEFARFLLACLDYRPEGETKAQATDRLSAMSSTERQRLLKESAQAELRAREIREELARKAARESADKWTRE